MADRSLPAALDMAFGCAELKYVILGKGSITCKKKVTSRKRQKRKQEIKALLVNQLLIDLEKWRILK